ENKQVENVHRGTLDVEDVLQIEEEEDDQLLDDAERDLRNENMPPLPANPPPRIPMPPPTPVPSPPPLLAVRETEETAQVQSKETNLDEVSDDRPDQSPVCILTPSIAATV
ncbi:hypothetical protein Dimus_022020, partial [Dionaea muscipula]